MRALSHNWFRAALLAFAFFLGAQALWILFSELPRSSVHALPPDADSATLAARARNAARWSAWLGIVRGDLWAESAYTYATLLWSNSPEGRDDNTLVDEARNNADRALSYAPHRAGVWLLVAGLASRFPWADARATLALKMSYYTGPSEFSLMPLRLRVATQSNAFDDNDIQQFVRRDLRAIVTQRPQQRLAIVAVYREASFEGKRLIGQVLAEIDPSLLQSIRSGTSP
jgi:hypothetical protein